MNKLVLSYLSAALLSIVPMAVFITPDAERLESERRRIAAFPDLPATLQPGEIERYFRGIDDFFADHFPLRASLLRLSMALHEAGGDSLNMDKCYRGKENWLFLGNSYGQCVDKLQGRVVLSGDGLKRQTEAYAKIHDAAKNSGAEFFIFIGPNKSSIYPEYLPPVIIPAQRRFISPLLEALKAAGVNVYDPTGRLLAKKSGGILYYRTDTHWNARGAYEAFEGFGIWAGLPELPPPSFVEAPTRGGDLVNIGGYANFPLSAGDSFALHWPLPPSLHEEDGLRTNLHAVSGKTAWVFGDSFAEALEPYITGTFKKVRFFKHGDFEAAMSSRLSKPDMLFWVVVERDFATPD